MANPFKPGRGAGAVPKVRRPLPPWMRPSKPGAVPPGLLKKGGMPAKSRRQGAI